MASWSPLAGPASPRDNRYSSADNRTITLHLYLLSGELVVEEVVARQAQQHVVWLIRAEAHGAQIVLAIARKALDAAAAWCRLAAAAAVARRMRARAPSHLFDHVAPAHARQCRHEIWRAAAARRRRPPHRLQVVDAAEARASSIADGTEAERRLARRSCSPRMSTMQRCTQRERVAEGASAAREYPPQKRQSWNTDRRRFSPFQS